ncbi:hypothetical protein A3C17_01680 [Candidatus Uhrbacteria bacterium RIFCSPHIGHO2_02_FULL_53_13]|uniref:Uncharacterized protein n=1 Tax=Candidatus Uhrbacteria bacterium RIFCSPHIGHO2_02_FULL_53_13 TaxID=1802389 RepID=A0A1F7TZ07_9BACT|nr:MAG: hypothetical protein A3C17_01680 [Candidatus Uhrbacteria bacterium RIFCSPHIGHO2_02_FULL_53_13]
METRKDSERGILSTEEETSGSDSAAPSSVESSKQESDHVEGEDLVAGSKEDILFRFHEWRSERSRDRHPVALRALLQSRSDGELIDLLADEQTVPGMVVERLKEIPERAIERSIDVLEELVRRGMEMIPLSASTSAIRRLNMVLRAKPFNRERVKAALETSFDLPDGPMFAMEIMLDQYDTTQNLISKGTVKHHGELVQDAMVLEGEERHAMLDMLLGYTDVVDALRLGAFGSEEHRVSAAESLATSGELKSLFEQHAIHELLNNPQLYELTDEDYTRYIKNSSVSSGRTAESFRLFEDGGVERFERFVDGLSPSDFEKLLSTSDSLFGFRAYKEHPSETDKIVVMYEAMISRVARTIQTEIQSLDEMDQLIDLSYPVVLLKIFPKLSKLDYASAMLMLREKGDINVPSLEQLCFGGASLDAPENGSSVLRTSALPYIWRKLQDSGLPDEALIVADKHNDWMFAHANGRDAASIVNELLDDGIVTIDLQTMRRLIIKLSNKNNVGGTAEFRKVIGRYVELEWPNDHMFLGSPELFKMLEGERRIELIDRMASEDPYRLACFWGNVPWSSSQARVAKVEALRDAGVEPFSFVSDAVLMDKLLRHKWQSPYKEFFADAERADSSERFQSIKNLYKAKLEQSESWFSQRASTEQDIVLALASLYRGGLHFWEDMESLMQKLDEPQERRNVERLSTVIEHGLENSRLTPDVQETLVHHFVKTVTLDFGEGPIIFGYGNIDDVFECMRRLRSPFEEGNTELTFMFQEWLKSHYDLSPSVLSAWMEVGDGRHGARRFLQNIRTLKFLESKKPGGAVLLEKFYGVRAFGRYPQELLLWQVDLHEKPDAAYGVLVNGRGDYNGALYNTRSYEPFTALQYHGVRIIEASSLSEVARTFIAMKKRGFPKASFALLGGHGTPESVQLAMATSYNAQGQSENREGHFDARHLKEGRGVRRFGRVFMQDGAPVIFNSCSTGQAGGIAENASEAWGMDMIAPDAPSFIDHIALLETQDRVAVERVEYGTEERNVSPREQRYVAGQPILRRAQ